MFLRIPFIAKAIRVTSCFNCTSYELYFAYKLVCFVLLSKFCIKIKMIKLFMIIRL